MTAPTRRRLLALGASTALLPMPALVAALPVADPAVALYGRWAEAEAAWHNAEDAVDALADVYFAQRPERPSALLSRMTNWEGETRTEFVFREDIGRQYDQLERVWGRSPSTIEGRRRKLELLDRHEAECAAVRERVGYAAAQRESQRRADLSRAIMGELFACSAVGTAGVAAKLRVAVAYGVPIGVSSGDAPELWQRALLSALRDAERLVGMSAV